MDVILSLSTHTHYVIDVPADFSLFNSAEQGYGLLEIFNETHLQYSHRRSNDSEDIDFFWLIKNSPSKSKWAFLLNPSVVLIMGVFLLAFFLLICNLITLYKKMQEEKRIHDEDQIKSKKYRMIDDTLSAVRVPNSHA